MKRLVLVIALAVAACSSRPTVADLGSPDGGGTGLLPPVIAAFSASAATVAAGSSVTVSWTVIGPVDSLRLDPGGVDALSSTVTGQGARPFVVNGGTTFTLTATNAAGSVTAQTSVQTQTPVLHFVYTDPPPGAAVRLVQNPLSSPTHLVLDAVVSQPMNAFGVALTVPTTPVSAGMVALAPTPLAAGKIHFSSSPPTAAVALGGAALGNALTLGVARQKITVADGDDAWNAGDVLFSVSFDLTPAAQGGINVWSGSDPRLRAAALRRDGSVAAAVALGDLSFSW